MVKTVFDQGDMARRMPPQAPRAVTGEFKLLPGVNTPGKVV